jgi:hypothetical protein
MVVKDAERKMRMKEIGRLNDVLAFFYGDKENVRYEDIAPHFYTVSFLNENSRYLYDDHYMHFDAVPVVSMTTDNLREMAYKLIDLQTEIIALSGVIDRRIHEFISNGGNFIATDGKAALFIGAFGYSYPRFKAKIDGASFDAACALSKIVV